METDQPAVMSSYMDDVVTVYPSRLVSLLLQLLLVAALSDMSDHQASPQENRTW